MYLPNTQNTGIKYKYKYVISDSFKYKHKYACICICICKYKYKYVFDPRYDTFWPPGGQSKRAPAGIPWT